MIRWFGFHNLKYGSIINREWGKLELTVIFIEDIRVLVLDC